MLSSAHGRVWKATPNDIRKHWGPTLVAREPTLVFFFVGGAGTAKGAGKERPLYITDFLLFTAFRLTGSKYTKFQHL